MINGREDTPGQWHKESSMGDFLMHQKYEEKMS